MNYKITHKTTYTFDSEVFLEPHYLRFRPAQTPFIDILNFSLDIQPQPTGHKVVTDEENNLIDFCWFDGMTKDLVIISESLLHTKDFNPFEFLIHPQRFNELPFEHESVQHHLLRASLEKHQLSKKLKDYVDETLKSASGKTIPFLTQLTNQIHKEFDVVYREHGSPFTPDQTFDHKSGSCRDLSWMLIHLLRQQGIAARFVSGYYYFEMEEPSYELHAWVDVFLPGTGWVGLDPSHGILTGNTHFPLVASAHYDQTMPVSGGIRGSATSQLITDLQIEKVSKE